MTGEPMRRASISIDDGRIVAIEAQPVRNARDLGSVAVIPALVNAHTHLELSYLRGKVPRTEKFLDWIGTIMATRRQYPDAADPRILDAARTAIADARACGTGLFGADLERLRDTRNLDATGQLGVTLYEGLGGA